MEPLAAGVLGFLPHLPDETKSDSAMSSIRSHHDVLKPGVDQAIPEHVGEPNEDAVESGCDPSETVIRAQVGPVPFLVLENPVAKGSGVKLVGL